MLNYVVPPVICKAGFNLFPAGFIIDGFCIEDSGSDEQIIFDTEIGVYH